LSLDNEGIGKFINSLEKEAKAIREDLLRLCWYMRGGMNYEDAMMLSDQERTLIGSIIKDNMDVTKKSGLPFF
jgi:hypothetical protein